MGCEYFFSHSFGHDFAGLVGIQCGDVMQGESFWLFSGALQMTWVSDIGQME